MCEMPLKRQCKTAGGKCLMYLAALPHRILSLHFLQHCKDSEMWKGLGKSDYRWLQDICISAQVSTASMVSIRLSLFRAWWCREALFARGSSVKGSGVFHARSWARRPCILCGVSQAVVFGILAVSSAQHEMPAQRSARRIFDIAFYSQTLTPKPLNPSKLPLAHNLC